MRQSEKLSDTQQHTYPGVCPLLVLKGQAKQVRHTLLIHQEIRTCRLDSPAGKHRCASQGMMGEKKVPEDLAEKQRNWVGKS